MTNQPVFKRLKTVLDPELNIDIVSLGLIYQVRLVGSQNHPIIYIKMTLTTPGCPLSQVIEEMIRNALFDLVEDIDRDIKIEVTFDPPWVPDMMSEESRLELGL